GEHRGAGIAGLVGTVPVAVIAGQVEFRLLRAHFRLLQTENVRIGHGAEVQKTLAQAGAQAGDAPGYQSHVDSPFPYLNFAFQVCILYSIPKAREGRRPPAGRHTVSAWDISRSSRVWMASACSAPWRRTRMFSRYSGGFRWKMRICS